MAFKHINEQGQGHSTISLLMGMRQECAPSSVQFFSVLMKFSGLTHLCLGNPGYAADI